MRLFIALLLVLAVVGCQEQPEPEIELRDYEEPAEFTWQSQGASYVFVCEEDEAGMRCVARSAGEAEGNVLVHNA